MNALEIMLAELESHALVVELTPCKRFVNVGGCYRVAVSVNCSWYRAFCAAYASDRHRNRALFDTRIKRANTLRVLRTLINRGESRSKYAPHLLRIARNYQAKGLAA